jgi:tRNA (guanine-N7-)-methyltransferase
MKRRSVFADKLKEFESFAFGDESTTSHRGNWRSHFRERKDNSPPLAGGVGGGGERKDEGLRIKDESISSFIPHPSSLLLEIGCYDAQFLARIAAKHPNTNFIGLDWKARPLYLGAQQIADQQLSNLSLLRARAQDLTAIFADGELDEIWLLHPEPCDRENERANRLMSEPFLFDVHRLLSRGGRLVLKTDHREYFESTLALSRSPAIAKRFAIEFDSSDFWNDADLQRATPHLRLAGERTFYESRFVRKKQPIYFVTMRTLES